MTMEQENIYTRIEKAFLANYDEVTEHDEPYISLSLVDEFPMPGCYSEQSEDFVDELFGNLLPEGGIEGIVVCISHEREDCVERVDEIDLADLTDDELQALLEAVEKHKGERKNYGRPQLVTLFRSLCFDIANSGMHGTYPEDIEEFNKAVEEGFSDNGESWTALDGYHINSVLTEL